MHTVTNVLQSHELEHLVEMMNYEVEHHLCPDVPSYQSYNDMHIKYAHDEVFKKFLKSIQDTLDKAVDKKLIIRACWFNICKRDSKFGMHTHENSNLSGVFYVRACTNYGTIFTLNNTKLQALNEDNSLILFDPNILHSIPSWNGEDRYTVAFDFVIQ